MVNSVTSRTRVGSHRGRRFSCTRAENVEPRPSCSVDKSNEPHQTRHQLRDQRTSRSFGIAARPLLVAVSDCEWFCVAAKMYLVGQRPCSACGCAQRLCCQLTSHTLVPLESGRGGFCFICFLLVMCESMYVCILGEYSIFLPIGCTSAACFVCKTTSITVCGNRPRQSTYI